MEHINLMGSEDVSGAGHNMQGAANDMTQAAASIEYSLERAERIMESFFERYEALLERAIKELPNCANL
ncbi:hypothetical protein LCGC14_1744970 [marine sediment metagenome]|uniref:Uncharacterized protein n=1 Tax=marine sediment metagenome TaxID=412755 RepID=A0A0F9HT77_9ZZZZ